MSNDEHLEKNGTAGSLTSREVCDKGKTGESRRRKAPRLTRAAMRHASRAAESHYRGGRVMRAFSLAVAGLVIGVAACGSYGTSSIEAPRRASVASVSVTLPSASLVAGQAQRAQAAVKDANGVILTDRSVTWHSSSVAVATVDDSGLIAGVAAGAATLSAVSEGVSGQAGITVLPPPPTPIATLAVAVNPAAITVGQTAHATVLLLDSSGNSLTGRVVTWQTGNPGVASVSSNGDVAALSPGTAAITATSEGKTASAPVSVNAPPPVPVSSVTVSPATISLQVGASAQLSAVTRDANGAVLTNRVISWTSANTAIATVSNAGLVTAVALGSVSISATSEGKIGSAA